MLRLLPIFVLLGTSVLWGSSWVPLKALNAQGADGLSLIACAYALLALMALPWVWRQRQSATGHLKWLMAIVLFGGAANVSFSYAIIYGDVVRVMVLFYLLPAWGVLGGHFILKENTRWWRWCGVVVALAGAFILLGGPKILSQPINYLDFIAIGAGIFFTASNLIFRGVERVKLAPKLFALFVGSSLLAHILLPAGQFWTEGNFPLGWVMLYASTWLLVANWGSQWAITQMPAGRSAIILIMELITAVATQVALTERTLQPFEWVGGSLIVAAALLEIIAAQRTPADIRKV
ncbi:MAG TPA: DMT family transporter [Cellvibrionaceae bacterium]